jgi:hypothetical protein
MATINLTNWRLGLPVDAKGGITGTSHTIEKLQNYVHDKFFFRAKDGALVFTAMAEGATTSGSKYARSELREMNGDKRASWTLKEGGTMTATLKINEAPKTKAGLDGRMVIGQIHGEIKDAAGKDKELVRLYWENGKIYFMTDMPLTGTNKTLFQFHDKSGKTPDIAKGEKFSYKIDAHGNSLKIYIYADGKVYSNESTLDARWQADTFYFKAGLYLGVNETNGSGVGQAAFYGLDFAHVPGQGLGGLVGLVEPVIPGTAASTVVADVAAAKIIAAIPAATAGADVISGTSKDDMISGLAGDDTISGVAGHDHLDGGSGHDILHGGSGNDKLYGGAGNDKLYGGSDNDMLYGGEGNDYLEGGAGDDRLEGGSGNDALYGGSGNDKLYGGDGDDLLSAGDGNDHLEGGTGNDRLTGGEGNDILYGGSGDDVLIGGRGADKIYTGAGHDTIILDVIDGTVDRIYEFSLKGANSDQLDLSKLLISFDDSDPVASFVRLSVSGGHTTVSVNADGRGTDFVKVAILDGVALTNSVKSYVDSGIIIAD